MSTVNTTYFMHLCLHAFIQVYAFYSTSNIPSGQAQEGNIHHQETGIPPTVTGQVQQQYVELYQSLEVS